jgi:hypothetical protein
VRIGSNRRNLVLVRISNVGSKIRRMTPEAAIASAIKNRIIDYQPESMRRLPRSKKAPLAAWK